MVVAWALAAPHASTPGSERVLVAIWCVEDGLERCAPPLTSDSGVGQTRFVPSDLLTRDCFAGVPERSARCLVDESPALAGTVETPLRQLTDRPDIPEGRDDAPTLYLRVQSMFVAEDVDASLARMRTVNVLIAALLPAAVFALASSRTRRAMAASGLLLVPLGLTLLTSIDTTSWTLTGALVTWAAILTFLEPGTVWRRALALLAAILGGALLLTPVSADPMRTGAFLGLSIALAVGLRTLDSLPEGPSALGLVATIGTAVAGIALWRTFRFVPWDRGLLDTEQPLRTLLRLPTALGDVVGQGVGLGHGDTTVAGWVGIIVLAAAVAVVLRGLHTANAWGRALAASIAAFSAMQATHVVVLPGATMESGLFTGRHFLPLVLLTVAAAVAVGSGAAPTVNRSATMRSGRSAAVVAAVVLGFAHAASLRTQMQRYVADADARSAWPVEAGWWWELPFGPGAVWVAGSLAFLLLAVAGCSLIVGSSQVAQVRPRSILAER